MTNVVPHNPAQTTAPLDFLSRFQPNQRMLIRSLYQAAAAQRHVTKVASVQFYVHRQITLRTFRALGESDGQAFGHSLSVLTEHKAESEAYALNILRVAGKVKVKA